MNVTALFFDQQHSRNITLVDYHQQQYMYVKEMHGGARQACTIFGQHCLFSSHAENRYGTKPWVNIYNKVHGSRFTSYIHEQGIFPLQWVAESLHYHLGSVSSLTGGHYTCSTHSLRQWEAWSRSYLSGLCGGHFATVPSILHRYTLPY